MHSWTNTESRSVIRGAPLAPSPTLLHNLQLLDYPRRPTPCSAVYRGPSFRQSHHTRHQARTRHHPKPQTCVHRRRIPRGSPTLTMASRSVVLLFSVLGMLLAVSGVPIESFIGSVALAQSTAAVCVISFCSSGTLTQHALYPCMHVLEY